MISRRFATPAALLLALTSPAVAQQVCPIPPTLPECLDLAVGEVQVQTLQPGQLLCVEPGAATQEFTVVPVNYVRTVDVQPTFLTANTGPVTGPPSPRPAASDDVKLAPLTEPAMAVDTDKAKLDAAAAMDAELAQLLARKRREDVLVRPGRGAKFSSTPPQVDDLLDIQVAPGCSGALDMRKARIEAVSPAGTGHRRLYIAQEVIDSGGGVWVPAVPGGFSRSDYETIRRAYEEPFTDPPPTFPVGATTIIATDARDVLASNFGEVTDIDGNGGTVVFFTRRLNEASPPASSGVILSRFDSRDFFSSAPGSCPRSNEGEIIYMAVPDPTGAVNSNVRTVSFILGGVVRNMAHQMTRLTNAGRRLYETGASLEEPWLDETLAWMSTELLFFRGSVGLTPRGDIITTDLTTGPNASRRVAAFNTYQNPIFGTLRANYLYATGGNYPGRYSVLTTAPANAAVWETTNERISYFYGVTAAFLRYALDRSNAGDAATLRALVESPLTGLANLESVFGVDMRDWARDFGVAMYADDNAFTVDLPYRTQSWNYRSLYIALNTSHQLTVAPLTAGAPYTPAGLDQNGGLQWLRFGVAAGTPGIDPTATFQYTFGPSAPITPLRVAVVRTK